MRAIGEDTTISIIAPVYNECQALDMLVDEIRTALKSLDWPGRWEIVLVNDGSRDGSAAKMDELAEKYPGEIKAVHLARNFGHAPAVCAGFDQAEGDAVILMDSDMQDDPAVFREMIAKWREGFEVVYAQRTTRKESALARAGFWGFYRLMAWLSNIKLPLDAGNFALMDRRVVDHLRSLPERNRYLPGLRAWVGFRQTGVPMPRRERYDSNTRVGFKGLWKLAMNAVFSFSYVPIFLFRAVGLLAIMLSAGLVLFALYHKLITGKAMAAWASQFVAIALFGGINLFGLGVIGEYVARIYDEVKGRPMYIVDRVNTGSKPTAPPKRSELIDAGTARG